MKIRSVTTAVFLWLLCGQALAQQHPVLVHKTTPGTIHGPKWARSGLGHARRFEAGTGLRRRETSAPTNAAIPAPSGGAHQ